MVDERKMKSEKETYKACNFEKKYISFTDNVFIIYVTIIIIFCKYTFLVENNRYGLFYK